MTQDTGYPCYLRALRGGKSVDHWADPFVAKVRVTTPLPQTAQQALHFCSTWANWLAPVDLGCKVRPECTKDFADGEVSLFRSTSDRDNARVAAALAAKNPNHTPGDYHFLAIPCALLERYYSPAKSEGSLADATVNAWHFDLLTDGLIAARLTGAYAKWGAERPEYLVRLVAAGALLNELIDLVRTSAIKPSDIANRTLRQDVAGRLQPSQS